MWCADRRALMQSCVGQNVDLHDKVEWHQVKPKFRKCEREGIVGGDEAPVGGVAQVVSHGVNFVGVHGEEGKEKDGEVRKR